MTFWVNLVKIASSILKGCLKSDICKNGQFPPPRNDKKEIEGLKAQNLPFSPFLFIFQSAPSPQRKDWDIPPYQSYIFEINQNRAIS